MSQLRKKNGNKDELYISVDIEASGPIPSIYSMLSIGACIVGNTDDNFYVEIKPINDSFIPKALEISGFTMGDLKAKGVEPETAMRSFATWIENASKGKVAIFVGYNAPFDWQFVNWYFHVFIGDNPFGINAIDIKAYLMGAANSSWSKTSSSNLPEWLQMENNDKHNALSDSIYQARIFDSLLSWRGDR